MRGVTAVVAAVIALLAHTVARSAEDAGTAPIPRVETGGHTSYIKKLAVDRAGTLVLTVSDDKTARLWQAATGRLLHVLRVPIRNAHEGQLYAGALSPDGRVAAVAGYTGFFEAGQSSVYFFDTASGIMALRLLNLSDAAIDNLVFSDDGKFLAVCLADGRGVRIYDLLKQQLVHTHLGTRDKIIGADFAGNGDLAITTLDGTLLRFQAARGFNEVLERPTPGLNPMHVQFSPDDRELAVGYDGEPRFSVFDAKDLREIYTLKLPVEAGQRGLHVVEWSDDGEYIYAGGEMAASYDAPIYRFARRGRGDPQRVLTSTRRISDMRRLPGGAMAFSSGEPEVGVIEPSGRARWRYRSPTMDLRRMAADFRLSASGNSVAFGASGGSGVFVFDVLAPAESALQKAATAPQQLLPPRRDTPGWQIEVSADRERLSINGTGARLDHREEARNWAATPDGSGLVVGTNWSVRMFDRTGKQRWSTALSADVNLTAVTADGASVVAALSDGTIRWFRARDGGELLALFAHRNGQDWIAWIPPGYYMSSVSGDNFIGWHVNRGGDRDPDFYRAIQFERILYRPDLVQAYFKGHGAATALDKADNGAFDVAKLDSIAPPRLQLTIAEVPHGDGQVLAQVSIKGESRSLPLQDWSLFVNGIPVAASQPLQDSERRSFSRELQVPLSAGLNQLRAESSNGLALGLAERFMESSRELKPSPGVLYVIAIGASDFTDPDVRDLNFAAQDAVAVARLFEQAGGQTGFVSTKTLVLADTASLRATRSNIVRSLQDFLATARGADTVVVFLASHGISDRQGNYYFVPADARNADIKAVQVGAGTAASLLRWDIFVDQLRHTAGRRLLIVDTCSSGAMGGTFDVHSLAKRSLSSNFALLAASRGNEESQELPSARHGLFTHALLEALHSGFDPNADGFVSLSEAFEYTFDKVQTLRNRAVGPQTPQLSAPDVLANMLLARSTAKAPQVARLQPGGEGWK